MVNRRIARVGFIIVGMVIIGFNFLLANRLTKQETVKIINSPKPILIEKKINKPLSEEGKIAYQRLLETSTFETNFLGFSGVPSKNVEAFKVIMKEELADESFKKLIKEAKMPGQLYALCGLYFTDPKYFCSIVEQYKNNDESVHTFSGCIISKHRVSNIIESKAHLLFNIPVSERSPELFQKYYSMNSNADKPMDIISGYFPKAFHH